MGEREGAYLSGKGNEVVFAKAVNLNVLDDDHFVVALVKEGLVDDVFDVGLVAAGEEEQGFGVSGGGFEQTLAVRVFADALEQGPYGALHLLQPLFRLGVQLVEAVAGAAG